LKPDFAEARVDYGRFLEDRGEMAAAIRELETALRSQPGMPRAHLELAMALGRNGNAAAAIPHLKIAADSTDPEVRAEALDVLHKLGQ
jgi:Tfp pilus assembly protein PilF